MPYKLNTIICSTRPGRVGPSIARWFDEFANQHDEFNSNLVDLADVGLPMYDEPNHPSLKQYQNSHTKAWSRSVEAADAFVFVLPEYNYCPPPSYFNALDYVYKEWNYKPCGFVSYGGVSGGLRSAQLAKQLATTVKMMPMMEGVMVQMASSLIDENGNFSPAKHHESSATAMLNELAKWTRALKTIR
ncbi:MULTISPECIES: NADPH-dependent FMN reductase [Photobacterium]|uniref:NADPH-dependent FMN reductase n=1 Tax=Photobacterium TaxID=657 RepID=UPI001C2D354B|nr:MULTISPECIES: NAD(P)H-dependent oxidoreductase [Photobacterium]MBV1843528.1 NAD(P)H-dependent oxidoreductase [Photobacterium ganghwense]